jgi:hypothetical protein
LWQLAGKKQPVVRLTGNIPTERLAVQSMIPGCKTASLTVLNEENTPSCKGHLPVEEPRNGFREHITKKYRISTDVYTEVIVPYYAVTDGQVESTDSSLQIGTPRKYLKNKFHLNNI